MYRPKGQSRKGIIKNLLAPSIPYVAEKSTQEAQVVRLQIRFNPSLPSVAMRPPFTLLDASKWRLTPRRPFVPVPTALLPLRLQRTTTTTRSLRRRRRWWHPHRRPARNRHRWRRRRRRRRLHTPNPSQARSDAIQKPTPPRKHLRHIPHHDPPKTREPLAVRNHLGQPRRRDVAAAGGAGTPRHAEQDLDVGVLAAPGPGVPVGKVKVARGVVGGVKRRRPAVVVVELDRDKVERDRLQYGVHGDVGDGALRGRGEVEPPPGGGGGVHDGAQAGREGRHVLRGRLKVKVEAVEHGVAKGAGDRRGGLGRPEHGPELFGPGGGLAGRREAALGVGSAAEGEEDGLSGGLACLDVSLDLGAAEQRGAWEGGGAAITGAREVEERRGFDAVEEGEGDDVDGRVGAVGGQPLLGASLVGRVLA